MPDRGLKRRVIVPLTVALGAMLGTVLAVLLVLQRNGLRDARVADRATVEAHVASQLAARSALLQGILATLQANREIGSALRARDRVRLVELAGPLFEDLAGEGITHLAFLAPDRTVVARVQEPDRFGDPIARPLVERTESTGDPTSALDLGFPGAALSLGAAAPWTADGERIGYVEIAQEIRSLTRSLDHVFGMQAFVVVDKTRLDRAAWETGMRSRGREPRWERYPSVVLVDGSTELPPPDLDARFAALERLGMPEAVRAEIDGRPYEGAALPLRDAGRRVVAQLVFLRDRSALLASSRRWMLGLVLLFGALGVIVWMVIDRSLIRNVVGPLRDLRTVTDGRGDLAEAVLAERADEMGDLGRAVNRLIGELRLAQEERTRKIVEAAHDAVVIVDDRGLIIDWNARAEVVFGWARDEALGMTLTETLIPEESHAAHLAGFHRFRQGGGGGMVNRRVEVTARRRGGARFPAELTIAPLHSAQGLTFTAFIRDITDRKQAEQALRASEERFRRLVETANVVPWEAASDTTRITYVGPQAEALLGFPLGEWYEEGFWVRQVHPEDRDYALTQLAAAAGGEEPGEFEYRLLHRDGHVVWVRDIVAADLGGERPVLRGFRFDVTERRRLEEELLQSQKMEAVGRLAGGIAHDFNNILTAILGYASLLEAAFPEESAARADVGEIKRAAGQAADLTQQLLTFARRQVTRPRELLIDEVVQRLEKMMGRLIGEDIDVRIDCAAPGLVVRVDPSRYEQVLVNLVLNARDAMPRGGVLELRTDVTTVDGARAASEGVEPGPFVRVTVSDSGVGMDAPTLARIFEPFFTTKKQGTGLGLSTAYGVLHQAGGFIQVESAPDQGSAFHVHLPLVASTGPEAGEPEEEPPATGDETILLVEDEPQVRELTERALTRRGYRVLVAQHGAEAVERSREHPDPIHLLLTDVVMPVMGGVRAADLIRLQRPRIRVLFVSGYSEEGLFRDGAAGGVHFLNKPFTPSELERKVREVLD